MKKIYLITLFTPMSENIGGPCAHPYFLLQGRDKTNVVTIYSFNLNKIPASTIQIIEKELNVNIIIIRIPNWYKLISKYKLTKIRFLLPYPLLSYIHLPKSIVKKIEQSNPDLIWFYPDTFIHTARKLPEIKKVMTGADSVSLHFYRVLKDSEIIKNKWLSFAYYCLFRKEVRLERNLNLKNCKIHLVGLEDLHFMKKINPQIDAFFLLHPHYIFQGKHEIFNHMRLKILIAGNLNIYTQSDSNKLVETLKFHKNSLVDKIEISYLGKDWEAMANDLSSTGYRCNHKKWVDNYTTEIIQHDVQIFPISVGTGTKGKVLDALVNGLLCIGSEYAFENICIRNMQSCLLYKNIDQIPYYLLAIYSDRERYKNIAKRSKEQIQLYHNPNRISKRFYQIALK